MRFLQETFDPSIANEFGTGFWDSPMFGSSDDGSMLFGDSLLLFLVKFGIHLLFCFTIVHFFYYRKSRRGDYYFTFMLFGVITSCCCSFCRIPRWKLPWPSGFSPSSA